MEARQCRRCQEEHPLHRFLCRRGRDGVYQAYGHTCRRCRTRDETERQRQIRRVAAEAMLFKEEDENDDEGRRSEAWTDTTAHCRHCPNTEEVDPSSGDELDEEEDEEASVGSLYIMENSRIPSELKVGRSRNPFKRARGLATSHNFEMNVVAIYPQAGHLETAVHHLLAADRVPGHSREFFRVSRKRAFSAVSQAMTAFEG